MFLAAEQKNWFYLTQNFPAMSDQQKRQFLSSYYNDFSQGEKLFTLVFGDAKVESKIGMRGTLLTKQLLFDASRQENKVLMRSVASVMSDK